MLTVLWQQTFPTLILPLKNLFAFAVSVRSLRSFLYFNDLLARTKKSLDRRRLAAKHLLIVQTH